MEVEYGVSLQLLRNRSGLTQEQAAKQSRIPLQNLRKAELSEYSLTLKEAERLSKVYWCDESDLRTHKKMKK